MTVEKPEAVGLFQLRTCLKVMEERNLEPNKTIVEDLQTIRGYLEFAQANFVHKNEETVEYKVRGGKRKGAGRPSLGTTKKVSITLPDEIWDALEIEKDDATLAGFLREIILNRH
ncbi:hypothetical protein [Bacillus suaedae]|uniref:Uncharacterized protein n=1 Tax=Halalkalibacter suaedae TaxID=2822140 RepID=A0A940WYH7_9BACI|nr:hypothetical protein [Bacillus suaedae]MBP3950379.1 hypothetical protein [Bacillus suaedae]